MAKKIKVPTVIDLEMNGKADVIKFNGWKYLRSYETIVAAIDPKGKGYRLYAISSATTWRHYNAFVDRYMPNEFRGPKGFAMLAEGEAVEGF